MYFKAAFIFLGIIPSSLALGAIQSTIQCIDNSTDLHTSQRILTAAQYLLDQKLISLNQLEHLEHQIQELDLLDIDIKEALKLKQSLHTLPLIESLKMLFSILQDKQTLLTEIRKTISTIKSKNFDSHRAIDISRGRFTPLSFVRLKSTPVRFQLPADNIQRQLPDKISLSREIRFNQDLEISSTPITRAMWTAVMGTSFYPHSNQVLHELTYPTILIFLNRLSERRGFKPVYKTDLLLQLVKATGNDFEQYKIQSEDELIRAAALAELNWKDLDKLQNLQKIFSGIGDLVDEENHDIYKAKGYRLPTISEMAMIFDNVRREILLQSKRSRNMIWPDTLSDYFSDAIYPGLLGDKAYEILQKKKLPIDGTGYLSDYLGISLLMTHEMTGDLLDLKNLFSENLNTPIYNPLPRIYKLRDRQSNYAGIQWGQPFSAVQNQNQRWSSFKSGSLVMNPGLLAGFIVVRSIHD